MKCHQKSLGSFKTRLSIPKNVKNRTLKCQPIISSFNLSV